MTALLREVPETARPVALSVSGMTKRFGATLALDDASLEVRAGTVHALLGGNGSGKSTLIKCLAGVQHADSGRLETAGADHELASFGPAEARAAGLRFVHQDHGLFDGLSVAENFALDAGYPQARSGRIDWRTLRRRVERVLADYELDVDVSAPINALRPADRTMVAIARALQDSETRPGLVLVLDEPTASLPHQESALLMARIRRRAELGQTVLLVSHRMAEVISVADDVTVFRDGRTVATLVETSPTEDELVALMAGGAVDALRPDDVGFAGGETRLAIRGLSGGPLRGVDLEVAAGEVVGVAGLVGSGRSSLLRMLFGAQASDCGSILLDGADFVPTSVGEAMLRGVALVPEDRAREAAFPDLALVDNLSVARLPAYFTPRGMNRGAERVQARRLVGEFGVRVAGPDALFSSMSGGNQQKAILARWLQLDPGLLLLDEPTQGVDVMSRVDIYRLVHDAAARGTSVVVASSDVSELLALCDRVVILRGGRVDQEVRTAGLDPHVLTSALLRSTVRSDRPNASASSQENR